MSIHIIKSGLLDSIQDNGRYGYQHLGIQPNGAMDPVSFRIANALTGNTPNEAVIEIHFPGPTLSFEKDACLALGGADFDARINDQLPVPVHQTVLIKAGSRLSFQQQYKGARVYLSVRGGFLIEPWLQSMSTNLFIEKGGLVLNTGNSLSFRQSLQQPLEKDTVLPGLANSPVQFSCTTIRYIPGSEIERLNSDMLHRFHSNRYTIDRTSNRMGYRLLSEPILPSLTTEPLSTGVTRGSIQLLPDGNLVILMADHQTTGGYPVMGHVITADLPHLAQHKPGDQFQLQQVTLAEAHKILFQQELHLKQIENALTLQGKTNFLMSDG